MWKFKRTVSLLVICVTILALVACLVGLFSTDGSGQYEFKSINGETVKIYGKGLYKNDSVSVASQGIASDFVTLIIGIPMLLISLYFSNRNSFRAKILLTGTLGYFLYTYMSYVFLWMYNRLFIVYVILMALSLYAFILLMMSFDIEKISTHFKKKLPVRLLGGFQIFIACAIGLLWLGKIATSIFEGAVPVGLEHYTTLVIQGMDLGIVVPTALLSGILLISRKPFGYLLSSVIIIKGITMLTAISAMIINMALHSVEMNLAEVIIFPLFNLLAIISLVLLMKNISENPLSKK
ncbi:hypothetical protein CLHOM_24140 [Clostridium homopropionicum DSM 5847]|uniref:Uncharacterized protein n=1 Tax=Clostridium homopropionicum DSM 5847 TaxID=1121318 RepID=A0A0L6Z954_9CLOT|nr:hypothetical protein [Clostridium homopropionicum]KOA19308.1 hypothetical protein CLHOM_24140 [Clostridium homopropionicum DSM 5847]SFG20592.1 hypothetical protein SAMN04488501_106173 [Clostridium homopropionicum]